VLEAVGKVEIMLEVEFLGVSFSTWALLVKELELGLMRKGVLSKEVG